MMKVILNKQVEKLGSPGDVVEVKPGYGRNFLIPHGMAFPATEGNVKKVEENKRRGIAVKEKEKGEAKILAEKLASISLTIPVEVGEDEKLFGSVTSMDIAEALSGEEVEIDKRNILLAEPIKKLGVYDVQVKVYPEIMGTLKVWVVKK
jgi:large subunit ribosomal protein L9